MSQYCGTTRPFSARTPSVKTSRLHPLPDCADLSSAFRTRHNSGDLKSIWELLNFCGLNYLRTRYDTNFSDMFVMKQKLKKELEKPKHHRKHTLPIVN